MSGHDHSHALPAAGRRGRLAVVFSITATIMVAEVIGALASGSLALLADAGHMFTDSAGLLIALTAATLALRPATDKRTWGTSAPRSSPRPRRPRCCWPWAAS